MVQGLRLILILVDVVIPITLINLISSNGLSGLSFLIETQLFVMQLTFKSAYLKGLFKHYLYKMFYKFFLKNALIFCYYFYVNTRI